MDSNQEQVKYVQWKSDSQKTDYAQELIEKINKAITDRTDLEDKRAVWLKMYEGRLERADKPKAWQSKLDVSTTREAIQSVRARLVNPVIQQTSIMTVKPAQPDFFEMARSTERFLEYALNKFNVQRFLMEWVEMAAVYGIAPVKVPFTNNTKLVKEWVMQNTPVRNPDGTPAMTMTPDMGPIPQTQSQWVEQISFATDKVGVFPELIQPSDLIYPATSADPNTAEFLSHRLYLDENTVKDRIRKDPRTQRSEWDCQLSDLSAIGSVDMITQTREELMGVKITDKRYEIHEVYDRKDFDGDGYDEEVIITIDRNSRKIVRAIYNYYHDYMRPFVFFWWEKRPNSMEGLSLCYVLEHLHRAYSAIINILLDSGILAVKGNINLTMDQQLYDTMKTQDFAMGDTLLVNSLPSDSTMQLQFGKDPGTFLMGFAAQILNHINILASINLYNQGQEQIQRPTAAGQNLLIQEGQQPLFEKLELFRFAITELSLMLLTRYKQFWKNSAPYYDTVDGQFGQQFLKFPPGAIQDQVIVEPKASSQKMNQMLRRQDIIGLMDRMSQTYQTMLQLLNQGAQAAMQGLPTGMASAALADAYQVGWGRLLEEFEVPEANKLNPPLQALLQVGQQYQQQIQQLNQSLQQAQQQLESLNSQVNFMASKQASDQEIIDQLKVDQASGDIISGVKERAANVKGKLATLPALAKAEAEARRAARDYSVKNDPTITAVNRKESL